MSSEKPENTSPNKNNDGGLEFDRSEALRKALLKLKEQGKIKDLPPDMFGGDDAESSSSDLAESHPSVTPEQVNTTTSDDVAENESEKVGWSAVLSGWDNTPQRLEKEERKHKTSEIQVLITPEQDEKMAQVAAEVASNSDNWGAWDESEDSNGDSASDSVILEDWNKPEIIEITDADKGLVLRKQITSEPETDKSVVLSSSDTPWTLQQFFNGEIDLDIELQKRFPTVPIVSAVKFRTLGSDAQRRVATLSATDGTASIIIDADTRTKEIQISFTFGSMLTLRYSLADLSDTDRSRWLELMRREKGGLAFLWGSKRWQKDYLICISRQYATKIYAFSPNNFESAVRLSQDVMTQVIEWLDEIWTYQPDDGNDDAPLLTW
ncbi:MAG: hypothetical protein Q9P01_07495 [Anaerolineae bacterium]|nr:hypothetical protein [Anaerolineae bacterium]MDQ7034668.1 hypothetical protein [Anaerolineae bacterium]